MFSLFLLSLSIFLPIIIAVLRAYYANKKDKGCSASPISYPIIGCLIDFNRNKRRILSWYTELLSHSPTQTTVIKRLGARRIVITANPDNVEYVLKTNFPNFPKGKPFADLLGDLLGNGIFNVDGDMWRSQRKLASHEFNAKSLRDLLMTTLTELVSERLLPLFEDAARNRSVLDLQDVLKRFAFDAVLKVSLGMDPICLDMSKPLPKMMKAFDEASEICAKRGGAPIYLIWKMKRAFNVGSERRLKAAVRAVHECVMEIIDHKKKEIQSGSGFQRNDLLSRLLAAGEADNVVRDMVISFVMAGKDTTSSAMTWFFWLLTRHAEVEEGILKEAEDKNWRIDFEGLKEMTFLKACLWESMRLYPPVAWDSKHAVNDDVLPDGTMVGKGDRVTYFPYGMGRMESLWGEDCLEYKPSRWLKEGESTVSPYKCPVFQAGPRVCLGRDYAFIQMKYVVASILRRFSVKPAAEMTQPIFVPLLTSHMAGGFNVNIIKRVKGPI